MMLSVETKFTVTLVAIGAATIAAKGLGAMAPYSKRLERDLQV
jgi:hypothetical protein